MYRRLLTAVFLCLSFTHVLHANSFLEELEEYCRGSIHGFASQGFAISNKNNYLTYTDEGSFEFSEIGLNYRQDLRQDLSAGVQLFVRNFGLDPVRKIVVDWALIDWYYRDYLGFRCGRVKLPYAMHNKIRDTDVARTWILLPQSVYDEQFRDLLIAIWGGSAYGTFEIGSLGQFEYEAFLGAVDTDVDAGTTVNVFRDIGSAIGASVIKNQDAKSKINYGAQVLWRTPIDGLTLGASGARGGVRWQFDFPSNVIPGTDASVFMPLRVSAYAFSVEYVWRMLTGTAEFNRFTVSSDSTLLLNPGAGLVPLPFNRDRMGFYFAGEAQVSEGTTLGSYYSIFYPHRPDKSSSDAQYQRDLCGTIRWDVNEFITLKAEAHRITGYGQLYTFDNPAGLFREWYLFLARATVSF